MGLRVGCFAISTKVTSTLYLMRAILTILDESSTEASGRNKNSIMG